MDAHSAALRTGTTQGGPSAELCSIVSSSTLCLLCPRPASHFGSYAALSLHASGCCGPRALTSRSCPRGSGLLISRMTAGVRRSARRAVSR